jgi:hypothetical protein
MGQIISAIVTSQSVKVNPGIVHFREDNSVVIPLDIDPFAMSCLVEEAARHHLLSDFVQFLLTDDGFNDDESNTHTVSTVIELIQTLQLSDFFLEFHSEWAGLAAEMFFIAIKDGKIMPESRMDIGNYNHDRYTGFLTQLGIAGVWWSNESRYYSYSTALKAYQQQQ